MSMHLHYACVHSEKSNTSRCIRINKIMFYEKLAALWQQKVVWLNFGQAFDLPLLKDARFFGGLSFNHLLNIHIVFGVSIVRKLRQCRCSED